MVLIPSNPPLYQLTSPFTSYKRMMKFYHMWCWLGGIIMGIITYTVQGAGGFFTVDGQSMKYHADTDGVIGFCLASSRICCEDGEECAEGVSQCSSDSNFLNAQKWPWILIYAFVIVVLIVSVWYVKLWRAVTSVPKLTRFCIAAFSRWLGTDSISVVSPRLTIFDFACSTTFHCTCWCIV